MQRAGSVCESEPAVERKPDAFPDGDGDFVPQQVAAFFGTGFEPDQPQRDTGRKRDARRRLRGVDSEDELCGIGNVVGVACQEIGVRAEPDAEHRADGHADQDFGVDLHGWDILGWARCQWLTRDGG